MCESKESEIEPPDEVVVGRCFSTQDNVVSTSIFVNIYVNRHVFGFCSVPDPRLLITDPDPERRK